MYTILRKLDDGFGSIHVVQKDEFETLTSLLKTLRDDLKIDIATNIEDGEIQSYIDDNDHNESLYEWVTVGKRHRCEYWRNCQSKWLREQH